MNFNSRTVTILKNFSVVNPSLLFKPGKVLSTISPQKTVIARATLDEEIPQEFAIYDLSRFLGVLSLFEKVDTVDFQEKFLTVQSGNQKVNYFFADKDMIIVPPSKELKLENPDVSFELPKDTNISKAMGVLQLSEVAVVGDGSVLQLVVLDTKNPTSDTFKLELGKTDKKFKIVFKDSNLRLIEDSYKVNVYKKGVGHFVGSLAEYYIAFEAQSSTF